jgi:hypothetical protein
MSFLDNDVQSLLKRVKALEADGDDLDKKLAAMQRSILHEVRSLITSSNKALASHLLDVILQEDRGAIKQLQSELEVTAGQASKSASEAQSLAATELTMSVELLRSKSYQFSHGD